MPPTEAGKPAKKVSPDTINRYVNGVYPAFAMLTGMQLEVFTPIGDDAMTVEEISESLGLSPIKLGPLLYALVAAGLLELDDGRFRNTEESARFLVRGQRSYMGGAHEAFSDLWSAALKSADSIRTGTPQAEHDFSAMNDDDLRAFFRGLNSGAIAGAKSLMRNFDFSGYRKLADVAAGSGGLAIELCHKFPDLTASAIDLETVTPIIRDFVADAGLEGRVEARACNVVEAVPEGEFDVAVLRSFLQVLSLDDARRAVRNVGRSLIPGGDIYILGRVLDNSRLAPADSVSFNVVFLNIYQDGQAHTEQAHREWLSEAGFIDCERTPLSGGYSVIRARKPE